MNLGRVAYVQPPPPPPLIPTLPSSCAHNATPNVTQKQVKIGMDVAASEFQTEDKMYDLKFKDKENDGSGKKTG